MRFTWFWTFWHWSRESFRTGSLLRSPLHGIGSHWDEWFGHEASVGDLEAIAEAGRTEASQRQFVAWLHRRWAREAYRGRHRLLPRFVLSQLAQMAPFSEWRVMDRYRERRGTGGLAAVVLEEGSPGRAKDVRVVEGILLPLAGGPKIVSEGFTIHEADLEIPREAALSMLHGRALLRFLGWWSVGGRRPHSRGTRIGLAIGWLVPFVLILWLGFGPEPGENLPRLARALVVTWACMSLVAIAIALYHGGRAWQQGRSMARILEKSQVRLRMKGGLTVKGGSAGLAFCLNTLLAVYRSEPSAPRRSWIWRRLFSKLRSEAGSWAATGAILPDGSLRPVVIDPKLRACLQVPDVRRVLTPRQPDTTRAAVARFLNTEASTLKDRVSNSRPGASLRLGFAAETHSLAIHPFRHAAHALMDLGGLGSRWQQAWGLFALLISGVILWETPNLLGILVPASPPRVVAPLSPSPYHLWVGLDTRQPNAFQVVFESRYWANRRARVTHHGSDNSSVRAEILLRPIAGGEGGDSEDGTVWIERRHRFLMREFAPGERVGRYSLAYLNQVSHE